MHLIPEQLSDFEDVQLFFVYVMCTPRPRARPIDLGIDKAFLMFLIKKIVVFFWGSERFVICSAFSGVFLVLDKERSGQFTL